MSTSISDADLFGLLEVIDAGFSASTPTGVPSAVLERAHRLVPCDVVSFLDMEPKRKATYIGQSFPSDGADEQVDDDTFWRHYWDCLDCCYPDVSGDIRTVITVSDFYTPREYHNTGMYADCMGPFGIEHEAMLSISAPAGRSRRFVFFRSRGPDFSDHERLLLSLLRPHLDELYQKLERERRVVPDLTTRQVELLRLVASGRSNAEIARELVVSAATVRKHLENIFARLDVTTRTGAVARAFPATPL